MKITRKVEVLQVGEDGDGSVFAAFCPPGDRDTEILRVSVSLEEARALGAHLYSEVELTIETEGF